MATLPRMRLARSTDVPKDAVVLPAAFASAWLDGCLDDPEIWDEVMEDFVRTAGLHVPDSFSMEDDDFEDYVRPRLEWALRSGELVLVETLGEPIERYIRPAGAVVEQGEEEETQPEEPKKAEEKKTTWIEFEVVGMDDKGIAGIRYKAKLPNGSTVEGRTSAEGIARLEDLDEGNIEFSLPDLDQEAWEKA